MTLRNVVVVVAGLASVGIVTVVGCRSAAPRSALRVVAADALTPAQQAERERVLAAKDDMMQQLLAALHTTLGEQGPAAAISVCRDEAPRIARTVGEEHGVRIGRTSHRLRNPDNQPPTWAEPWVAEGRATPVWLTDDNGRLCALLPIKLTTACVRCHGPLEQIDPDVRQALAANYPADEATGFEAGDLRGWFWMETQ